MLYKHVICAFVSRENPSSFVIRTRIMFIHAFGDYTLPEDPFSPLTRKLCRYHGADVRAISEILQHDLATGGRERMRQLWELGQPTVALRRENARANGGNEMRRNAKHVAYSDGYYGTEYYGNIMQEPARVQIHTRAYFISAAGELLFSRPSEDKIREIAAS